MTTLPALAMVGTASKRLGVLELATEADQRGFTGLAVPGFGGLLAMCASLAHVTKRIAFWPSIQPIYLASAAEVAAQSFHISEVSGGRFRLGLGVSHARALERLGVTAGKPLSDMRDFVTSINNANRGNEQTPPIYIAALRDKMFDLAIEIGNGALWANASHRYTSTQVARIPAERRGSVFLATMVPTVIDTDRSAARAIHRRTLGGYVILPNYRNYWRTAGYDDEMNAIEVALSARDRDAVSAAMSDRWIDDCTVSGSATEVRDQLQRWFDIGVTPIAVMSSTTGGQAKAIGELFELYS